MSDLDSVNLETPPNSPMSMTRIELPQVAERKNSSLDNVKDFLDFQHKQEVEDKKLENSWTSCCFNIHKGSTIYFTQVGAVSTCIVFSGAMLASGGNPVIYGSLLSLCLGYLFPNPQIKDD